MTKPVFVIIVPLTRLSVRTCWSRSKEIMRKLKSWRQGTNTELHHTQQLLNVWPAWQKLEKKLEETQLELLLRPEVEVKKEIQAGALY